MIETAVLREKIRKRLIQCRTDNGLTQKEVGVVVGKSAHAVASWEQGLSLPDAPTLFILANYYERTLDYMYGGEE